MVEKLVNIGELMDFLQQKHHNIERSDSAETKELNRYCAKRIFDLIE